MRGEPSTRADDDAGQTSRPGQGRRCDRRVTRHPAWSHVARIDPPLGSDKQHWSQGVQGDMGAEEPRTCSREAVNRIPGPSGWRGAAQGRPGGAEGRTRRDMAGEQRTRHRDNPDGGVRKGPVEDQERQEEEEAGYVRGWVRMDGDHERNLATRPGGPQGRPLRLTRQLGPVA